MTNTMNDVPNVARLSSPEAGEVTVASYRSYSEAQSAVDHLSDRNFPSAT